MWSFWYDCRTSDEKWVWSSFWNGLSFWSHFLNYCKVSLHNYLISCALCFLPFVRSFTSSDSLIDIITTSCCWAHHCCFVGQFKSGLIPESRILPLMKGEVVKYSQRFQTCLNRVYSLGIYVISPLMLKLFLANWQQEKQSTTSRKEMLW